MARNNNLTDFLKDVADAIREKTNASGLISPQDFPERIAAIETGGGGGQPEGTHTVRFIDVDGTILKSQYVADGGSATPPANPTREKCEFVKWSDPYTAITKDTNIFPLYKSADGHSWYRVKAAANDQMNLSLQCDTTSPATIDWGDGATDAVTSRISYTTFRHVYAEAFDGWVKVSSEGGYRLNTADEGNPAVTEVIVGDKVSALASVAREMVNLTAIVIPETVTIYSGRLFVHCASLSALVLPDGVTAITTDIASAMVNLKYVRLPGTLTAMPQNLLAYCYSLQSVDIPSGVTSIGANAFRGCSSLQSVDIPSGVTSIEAYAFQGCYSLQSVDIPSGVTSIGAYAFQGCSSLQSVDIPSGVTSIGAYAFQGCANALFSVDLSDITPAAGYFKNCKRLLGAVTLNSTAQLTNAVFASSGISQFYAMSASIKHNSDFGPLEDCPNLVRVELPNTSNVASATMCNNKLLALVILGANVTSIESRAMDNCPALARVVVKASTPPTLASNALKGTSALTGIYVPDASVEAYKTATNWSAFADIIKPLSEFVE